jgi:hypothetical protein
MKNKTNYIILISTVLVFVLLQFPNLSWIQYPFRLLGTWFHEMGHGLTALLVGGDFIKLVIYSNGGGTAYSQLGASYLPYNIAHALVAAGGLLGSTLVGALLIISAKTAKYSVIALRVLTGIMVLSLVLWIRSYWGVVMISSFAVVFVIVSLLKSKTFETALVLFLGLQANLSSYFQIDYLFTKEFVRNDEVRISDTQAIAQELFLPYWFWGFLILCFSIWVLWKSVRFYFKT